MHKSFITCMMTSACFFFHLGKVEKMCWAEVKHSHSNTTASISFRVNRIVQSILPNLLRLPPRCNPYCLRNSFILSPCRLETVLCWFKAFLTGCHYSPSHTLHHLHINYILQVYFISSFDSLCSLRLTRVLTLVLVLQCVIETSPPPPPHPTNTLKRYNNIVFSSILHSVWWT